MTVIIVLFSTHPAANGNLVLVINAASIDNEERIMETVREFCGSFKTRARNVTRTNLNLAIEIRSEKQAELIRKLMNSDGVISVSLVEHDGDVTV